MSFTLSCGVQGPMGKKQDTAITVCAIDDLQIRDARGFVYHRDGQPREAFVVRDGSLLVAYRNVCPHAGNPLNWKPHAFLTRNKDQIMCSVHGAVFEIETGLCTGGACPGRRLSALRVENVGGLVMVYPTED